MVEIVEDYVKNGFGIEALCSKYKFGKLKIKQILSDNNIELKKKGNQQKYGEILTVFDDYTNKSIECKCCGKYFNDVENISGAAIGHIEICQPNVDIPTKYKRSMVKKTTGKYWHFEYFNIIDKTEEKKQFKCPECDWTTFDLNNVSGSFTKHIENEHGDLNEFRTKYPENEYMFKKYVDSEKRIEELEHDSATCKVCGEKMRIVSYSHLKKHNLTTEEYKNLFPNEKFISNKTLNIVTEHLKTQNINMKPTWQSKGEIEVLNFIKELNIDVDKCRNRKLLSGKEIDITISKNKVCFEYNGLYYHTEKMGKNSEYHLNKTMECMNKGYQLYHIFEDEWIKKNEIVKTKIKHILESKVDFIKIESNNVKILIISNIDKKIFLNENDILGDIESEISYGAYYDNILVGVICLNKKIKEGDFELMRLTVNNNYLINNIYLSLLNHFIDNNLVTKIIFICDRRWYFNNEKNEYLKLGFKLIETIKPIYWYYNQKINLYERIKQFTVKRNILKNKYPNLNINRSEDEIMKELNYDKIWDCGYFKYEYIV